jgi:hypothetical protein
MMSLPVAVAPVEFALSMVVVAADRPCCYCCVRDIFFETLLECVNDEVQQVRAARDNKNIQERSGEPPKYINRLSIFSRNRIASKPRTNREQFK